MKEDTFKNIGYKIRYFRKRSRLSQFNLEIEIGASLGSLSRIENGEVNPTKETILKIIDALKLTAYEASTLFNLDLEEYFNQSFNNKNINSKIEKRGPLVKSKVKELRNRLSKGGNLIGQYKQLSIFIEFDNPYLGSVENTKATIAINFVHNILTKKVESTLKAKTDKMESSVRKEVKIPFEYKDLDQIKGFLSIFNITTGCPRYYYREDYEYRDFIFTIKLDGFAPDHFEIKAIVNGETSSDLPNILRRMETVVRDLGLNLYSEEEYKQIMLKTYIDNPPVSLNEVNINVIN